MWELLSGFQVWIIGGILYGLAVLWCWLREEKMMKLRRLEQEERRRIQNAEWEEQLRRNPGLRLLLALRNDLRREHNQTMDALRVWKHKRQEPIHNWKEEGF